MWRSGKEIANASLLGRGARHTVTAAPLAGPATFSWGQVSTHRGLNASHGFFRSYTRKPGEPKSEEESKFWDELARLGLIRQDPRKDGEFPSLFDMAPAPMPQEKPAVAFDLNARTPKNMERSNHEGICRLTGYSPDSESIKIHFEQQDWWSTRPMKLSKFYLRDICQCSRCVCPSTGQKTFATCDIPDVPRVLEPETESIRLSADGSLEITWKDEFLTGDNHTSVYPEKFLNCLAQTKGREIFSVDHAVSISGAATLEQCIHSRQIDFHDWMEGGAKFARAVLNLHQYGLVVIHGVPRSKDCVRIIAEKIGHLQSTTRGLTWDVISEPGGETAASNESLHQDMLYLNDQPQVQFLHCLENEPMDNAFLFSDGLYSAFSLSSKDPGAFHVLRTQMVNFRHWEAGRFFSKRRPVIRTTNVRHHFPISIAWSPAFQGPFNLHERSNIVMEKDRADESPGDWSKAARAFRDEFESHVVTYRPRPGDCVIFNSRRILHGGKQLSFPAGRKHLRGAYVDAQTLKSAFVGLVERGLLRREPSGIVFPPSSSN